MRLDYKADDGQTYELNLIDTPGHVDFTYEVSRSLAACEGALLVVDATQGVEAQTLANAYLALDDNLEIIPVINKIDLPAADPERRRRADRGRSSASTPRTRILGSAPRRASASTRSSRRSSQRVPPPKGDPDAPLRGADLRLLVRRLPRRRSSYVRVIDGTHRATGMKVAPDGHRRRSTRSRSSALSRPKPVAVRRARRRRGRLRASPTSRTSPTSKIGDTVTDAAAPAAEPLPGFKELKPMVFAGLYPVDADDYRSLRDALEKLRLNDASFIFEPETSAALGFGFRCGFLGLLHMEIVQERLEREFDLDLITTAPGVRYRVTMTDGDDDRGRQPRAAARPAGDRARSRSRSSPPPSSPATSTWAPSSSSARTSAASRQTARLPRRRRA
ncbi:MAG: GTP-binding protein [Bryobacterales bacterium]|nr:GTP-binding protein [Bryobacterales bacterium]